MRRIILLLGLAVIIGMCLYPPWTVRHESETYRLIAELRGEAYSPEVNEVYRSAFAPTEWGGLMSGDLNTGQINVGRLLVQLVIAGAVTAALCLMVPTGTPAQGP